LRRSLARGGVSDGQRIRLRSPVGRNWSADSSEPGATSSLVNLRGWLPKPASSREYRWGLLESGRQRECSSPRDRLARHGVFQETASKARDAEPSSESCRAAEGHQMGCSGRAVRSKPAPSNRGVSRSLDEIATSVTIVHAQVSTTQTLWGSSGPSGAGSEAALVTPEKKQALVDAAKSERESGYPTLYSQFVIALWSATDTFLCDLSGAWLSGPPSVWLEQAKKGHDVDVREYERKRAAGDVGRYLFDLLRGSFRHKGKGSHIPFVRWMAWVNQIGLGSPRLLKDRQNLMGLSLVRNLLATRRAPRRRGSCKLARSLGADGRGKWRPALGERKPGLPAPDR
jgi:hypothetical protein